MSRKSKKWAVLVGLLAVAGAGCTPSSLGWLLQDSKTKPENPLPPKEGKREVTVLVIVDQSKVAGDPMFMTAARDIAASIGTELVSETKDTRHPIVVVDRAKLERKQKELGDWRTVGPGALGKQLGADYVIDASIDAISLYSKQDGNELFAGSADVTVDVYDTATPDVKMQSYPHPSRQPQTFKDGSPRTYCNRFLKRLGVEIARKHVPSDSNERMRRID